MKTTMRLLTSILLLFLIIQLSSCSQYSSPTLNNVGVLIDGYLEDEEWNQGGYDGLQRIKEKFDVDVFFNENVQTKNDIINAVDELDNQGVNLIFGHSSRYGKMFVDVAKMYPHLHFVYFNGGYFRDNVTSLNINSHAMGFFSGMIAGRMTKTNHVGIIAATEWQPEIEGFFEGVKYENPETVVHIDFITEWDEQDIAIQLYDQMRARNVDVIYPSGHSFSKDVVEQAIEDNVFSIGYFLKEEDYDAQSLLTSTIQHIDLLYEKTAEKYNNELLEGGIYFYDFSESTITFGPFSPLVPKDFKRKLDNYISKYEKTNLLPNELSDRQ